MRLYKIAHVALYFGIFGPWGFFATFICDASDGLAGWGGRIRTSAFQNRNSPRLSAWAAGFEPLHLGTRFTALAVAQTPIDAP